MAPAIWPLIALSASMMALMGLAFVGSVVVAGGAVVSTGKGVPALVSQNNNDLVDIITTNLLLQKSSKIPQKLH